MPSVNAFGRSLAQRGYRILTMIPSLASFVCTTDIGAEHGLGWWRRLLLVLRFRANIRRVKTLSGLLEHLELAAAILRVPRSTAGVVVECGCYLGGSAVNLSLACQLAGRRLVVCDSFEGLPEPRAHDREHEAAHKNHRDIYYRGRFAASLEEVRRNIARLGSPETCDYIVGFYDTSLADFGSSVVVGFLDVDLIDSVKPCLKALWPHLQPDCRIYVHEASSLRLAGVFFEELWWRKELGEPAPGLVGAGTGLPLRAIAGSELGYAQRSTAAARAACPTTSTQGTSGDMLS